MKHQHLSDEQRQQFITLVSDVKKMNPLFRLISHSSGTMVAWTVYVLCFLLFSLTYMRHYQDIILFLTGLVCLQIFFVISHMVAHSLFLEYDVFVPNNTRASAVPIYYYAFYHHHHCEPDNKDDWAETYGEYMSGGKYNGQKAIIAAHWHGYSLLIKPKISIVIIWCCLYPKLLLFFAGHELGVYLLPFAHMWQHVSPNRFGPFKWILKFLETIGLIANKDAHKMHHIHTHPTVYQDFSSSGLYLKCIDRYLNNIWNESYIFASNNNLKLHDVLENKNYSYTIIFVLIPFLFYIINI